MTRPRRFALTPASVIPERRPAYYSAVEFSVDCSRQANRIGRCPNSATPNSAVFGVKDGLISKVETRSDPVMPDGIPATAPWHLLTYNFRLKPGEGTAPKPTLPQAASA